MRRTILTVGTCLCLFGASAVLGPMGGIAFVGAALAKNGGGNGGGNGNGGGHSNSGHSDSSHGKSGTAKSSDDDGQVDTVDYDDEDDGYGLGALNAVP